MLADDGIPDAHYFSEQTIDDLMRGVVKSILVAGTSVSSTKGDNLEISSVLLALSNPRARISRTESRGRPFSCLGELCWYLAGSNDTDFITYYISKYGEYNEGGKIHGGYGPRLFVGDEAGQVDNICRLLSTKRSSRQAVIQLFDSNDIELNNQTFKPVHKDIPCTCSLQFLIREDRLNLITMMRSNDIIMGFPHDVFCFTMLQEIVARRLGIGLGWYNHFAGSMHLYDKDKSIAETFLGEGFQSTTKPMPDMPIGDPSSAIQSLLDAESRIRSGLPPDTDETLEDYWQDLIKLLSIFRFSVDGDLDTARALGDDMTTGVFDPFIQKRLST